MAGPTSVSLLNQTAKVIETAGADVAVLCEHMGSAQPLADLLALHCHEVTAPPYRDSVAVLSRFPVIETFDHGVRLALTEDETACVFGAHLSSSPYQPYQVRDGAFSRVEEVVENAETTRGPRDRSGSGRNRTQDEKGRTSVSMWRF